MRLRPRQLGNASILYPSKSWPSISLFALLLARNVEEFLGIIGTWIAFYVAPTVAVGIACFTAACQPSVYLKVGGIVSLAPTCRLGMGAKISLRAGAYI